MSRIEVVAARLDKLRQVTCRLGKHREPWSQLATQTPAQLGRRATELGGLDIGGGWEALMPDEAQREVRHVLSCGMAYGSRKRDAERRERLADELFAELDREQLRVVANHAGAGFTPVLDRATFERSFLLVDPKRVVLLVVEDED